MNEDPTTDRPPTAPAQGNSSFSVSSLGDAQVSPVGSPKSEPYVSVSSAAGHFRWVICALLFCATTINYMDRQVISYLKEFFCRSTALGGFGWSNSDFSYLTSAFTGIYAGITVLAGWFIDKIGTKLGLA
jgi:hypothetical protein